MNQGSDSTSAREASLLTFLFLLFGGNLKFQTLAARFGSCAPVEITPLHRGSAV